MEGISYIQIRKAVEEAFPLANDFDYTKISPEDLWLKVLDALKEHGIFEKLEPTKVDELRQFILRTQENAYGRESAVVGKRDSKTFNQNNYFLDSVVLKMKNKVMSSLLNGRNGRALINYLGMGSYNKKFGTDEEIEALISKEAIADYLTKALAITKEDIDGFYIDILRSDLIDDILYHFGLLDEQGTLGKAIIKSVEKAIEVASTYIPAEKNKYGSDAQYEGVTVDNEKFVKEFSKYIPTVIAEIEEATKRAYENKKENDKKEAEALNVGNKKAEKNDSKQPDPTANIIPGNPNVYIMPPLPGEHEPFLAAGSLMDWGEEQTDKVQQGVDSSTKEKMSEAVAKATTKVDKEASESDFLTAAKAKLAELEARAKKEAELILAIEQMEKDIAEAKNRLAELEANRQKMAEQLKSLQSGDNKGRN